MGVMPARGMPTYACIAVEADDIDDVDVSYRAALEPGGTSVVEPTDNPGGVRSAYIRDLDGNVLSIRRSGTSAPPTA